MNDREALEKLRGASGRTQAAKYLYRRYAPRFFGYYLKHRLTRGDAETLVEDVFVEVVERCGDFLGETRPDACLWAIARGALLGHFRSRRPQLIADDHALESLVEGEPAVAPVPSQSMSAADCARSAYAAFAAQYADRAEMLAHLAFEGWSLTDMAAALGRSPEAAREYVAESRAKLRTYLEPCLERPA
jgi:RNA polymerase sigma factor (sigma-70 family)